MCAHVHAAYTEYIDAHSSMEGAQDRMQGGAGEVDVVSEGGRKGVSQAGTMEGGREAWRQADWAGRRDGETKGLVWSNFIHTHSRFSRFLAGAMGRTVD